MTRKNKPTSTAPRRRPLFFIGTLVCLGTAMLFYLITSPRRRRAAL